MSQSIESPQQPSSPSPAALTPNDPKRPISEYDSDDGADRLSPRQWQAIELLAAGKRVSQVVTESGVSRKTLYRWRHEDAEFIAELHARRREIWSAITDRLRSLLPAAIEVVAADLAVPSRSDTRPYRAAMDLLRLPLVTRAIALQPPDASNDGAGQP